MSGPLVPSDCDLRDFPFTPLFRARLFGSSFHARANDAEWRAGVTLWLKSWDQVPAGSLPDDDIDLCRLAELGRDLKAWRKVKEGAMRGWVLCDDGRLYHPVVAEGVLEAWDRRSSASRKGKAGAEKRWGAASAKAMPEPMPQLSKMNGAGMAQLSEGDARANATAIARAMPGDSNRQKGSTLPSQERNQPRQGTDLTGEGGGTTPANGRAAAAGDDDWPEMPEFLRRAQ